MIQGRFGYYSYRCNTCRKDMEFGDIAYKRNPKYPGDRIMQEHYCSNCAPAKRQADGVEV